MEKNADLSGETYKFLYFFKKTSKFHENTVEMEVFL
jgi:hypothetical protein